MQHVVVNEVNIAVFELVKMTGNSKEELLAAAARAEADGYTLSCKIPDPIDPVDLNAFEHFHSSPAPVIDPDAEVQLDIADQVNMYSDRCRYEFKRLLDGGDKRWVCIIHHTNSRHEVDGPLSQVQCLFLDPYPREE